MSMLASAMTLFAAFALADDRVDVMAYFLLTAVVLALLQIADNLKPIRRKGGTR